MHPQALHLLNALTFLSLSSSGLAQQLSAAAVPASCNTICEPIVELTNTCNPNDRSTGALKKVLGIASDRKRRQDGSIIMTVMDMNGTSMEEMNCVCQNKSFDVSAVMGLCSSCMDQEAGSGNKTAVMDLDKIMTRCRFPATSYAPSATTVVAGVSVSASKPTVSSTNGVSGTASATTTATATSSASQQLGAGNRVEAAVTAQLWGTIITIVGLGAGLGMGLLW